MASLFGALGSLAESYGLARQQLQENALAQLRQRMEQQYVDIAGQRLGAEREEQQRLREQFETSQKLEQQKFTQQQQEFEWRQKQAQRPQLLDFGFPIYTRPGTNERFKKLFNQTTGEWTEVPIPGTGQFGVKEIKEFIGRQDKEFQPYLNSLAETEVARNPDDPGKAFDKIEATAEKMREEKAKANKGGTRADALAGLDALEMTLHGGMGQKGLLDTVGILDDPGARDRMILGGVGEMPSTATGGGMTGRLLGRVYKLGVTRVYGQMSPQEQDYINQLNVARSQIPVLRQFTGNVRPNAAQIESYIRELGDPETTTSATLARQKIALIDREILAIRRRLAGETTDIPMIPGTAGATPTGGGGLQGFDPTSF